MEALIITIAVAIVYALIRAKHDSYLSHGDGKWKTVAFIEGVFWAICSTLALSAIYPIPWYRSLPLGLVFGLSFWIVFDSACGWLRARNIFHLGSQGFDLWITNIVKGVGWAYLVWKLFWLVLAWAFYWYL